MDSFEFLGGRYNRPEQIMSGPMQAFRAQNAATGRTVFIHRVSTKEAPEEQAALLKLLTTALVKSADAKRLVLDFGEERGYWYVVTESDPQCALLREWLQLEINAAAASSRLGLSNEMPAPEILPAGKPAAPAETASEPGEFTRFLHTRTPSTAARNASAETVAAPRTVAKPVPPVIPNPASPSSTPAPIAAAPAPVSPPIPAVPQAPAAKAPEAEMGEFTRVFQSAGNHPPSPPPPAAPPPSPQRPGEFTSFFNAGQSPQPSVHQPQRPVSATTPAPPAAPVSAGPEQASGGEFTRFFSGGLPPSAPKPPDRTGNSPFVQRPKTPAPLPPLNAAPKPADNGEFTQLFSRPANAAPVLRPPSANVPAEQADNLFSQNIDIPKPLPASQPAHGEFTQMFGGGGRAAAPPLGTPAVVAQPREKSMLDEAPIPTKPLPQVPKSSAGESQSDAPGEFTRIMQGPAKVPAAEAAAPAAKPVVTPATLAAPVTAVVDTGKKKMVILFSVLAALAAVLVLVMAYFMRINAAH